MVEQQPKQQIGVGTIIRATLHTFGISDNGCGCTELAAEMDRVGPEYVEQHFQEYLEKMKASIQRWRKNTGIPVPTPPEITVKKLIEFGISKSRQSILPQQNLQNQ